MGRQHQGWNSSRQCGRRAKGRRSLYDPRARRLHVERLEDRRMLAAVTVTNNLDVVNGDTSSIDALIASDGGDGISLREAIEAANMDAEADTIDFDGSLSGEAILLTNGELVISEELTIDAIGLAENVMIDAQQNSRIFNITAPTGNFTLSSLTLVGGQTSGDNAGSSDTTYSGGAIRALTTGNLTLNHSTIIGNRTMGRTANGGGIFSIGTVSLTQSMVSGNSTSEFFAKGGGIYSTGHLTITESTVSGNSTAGDSAWGGGIRSYSGIVLSQSTVSGNSTTGDHAHGGGVLTNGSISVTQSTVSGNSTIGIEADGGGIFASGSVTLSNSTVADNQAMHSYAVGGGIWINDDLLTIRNSIVADNTAGGGMADIRTGGALDINYSLVEQTGLPFTGFGNITGFSAGLGPLQDNGGPTQTHALLAGSLAINRGDPTFATPPDFDQRGARFDRVKVGRLDIGAYESDLMGVILPEKLVVDTTTDESNGNYSAGDLSLREAVLLANISPAISTITFDATISGQTIEMAGTEMELTSALTIDASPLAENITINAQQNSRIFNIIATTGDFTLAGLTLIGGRTVGNGTFFDNTYNGGAIRSLTIGNLTLIESTVSGNSTWGSNASGGGIYSFGAVMLIDSSVSDNSTAGSEARGGGLSSYDTISLIRSNVHGNSTTGYFAPGGGISCKGVSLTGSTVLDNSTEGALATGGGIRSVGDVSLAQSSVSGNSTAGSNARGGGINTTGTVSLTDSSVNGNTTSGNGADSGGILSFGTITLTNSTVSNNSTAGDNAPSGGISAAGTVILIQSTVSANSTTGESAHSGGISSSDDVTLIQSTVSGNSTAGSSANGGGILAGGEITLNHSTVTNNHAKHSTSTAGAIWNFDDAIVITNSIVAGNTAGGGNPNLSSGSGALNVNYSVIGNTSDLTVGQLEDFNAGIGNLLDVDPRLGPLTNNGGPTKTHALLAGSPAIDAGDPGIVAPPSYDQRGAPYQRIADGDADGMARIDIGAFEVPTTFVVTTELDEFDGVIDHNLGGAMSLREAITLANLTPQPINITFDPSLDGATIMLDQLNLGALPTVTDNLSIDAVNLVNGLTIHAGHGLDATSNTGDGIRIFEIDDGDEDSSSDFALFGLILSGGDISGSGGAIRSTENLTLVDSTITNNAATSTGGGVSIFGNLTVHNSEISKNFSDLGGGIQQATGDLSIRQSSISGNMAGQGGGILSAASKVEIADSSISGNYVSGFAAGAAAISVDSSTMAIARSTISDNHAVGYHDSIGSIWSRDSEVTLSSSTVSGNTDQATEEPTGGGGVRINGGNWTIQYSTISGNSTNGRGGGINNEEGELIILHSTIANNYAPEGYGSGMSSKSGTTTEIISSIIAGNVNSDIDIEGSTNPFVSDGYNLIGTGDAVAVFNQPGDQTGILDPHLGPLADNGGPTMTHALLPGSPALDAGNGGGATDQRGMTAPIDLPGIANPVGGDGSDIGAYEAQVNPSADFDSDLDVDGIDFLAWQRGFGLTTDASLPDGNSDDDGDTDHSDFAAWEVSFGETLPSPLAALNEVETEPVLAATAEQDFVAPTFTLTATDVSLLQETREASRTLPQQTPVVQRQPGVSRTEVIDQALSAFVSSGKVDAKSTEFGFERPQLKMVLAHESVVDEAFKELAKDGLANGLNHRSLGQRPRK